MNHMYWSRLFFLCLVMVTNGVDAKAIASQCVVTGIISTDVLNVRSTPHYRSKKVGAIPSNATAVLKLGPSQAVGKYTWFKIRYQTQTGWVNSKFLTCQLAPKEAKAVAANRARNAVYALRAQDLARFATYVHPIKGVRFSPYAYVNLEQDLVYRADQVKALLRDEEPKQWGYYDGSGEPILLTFAMYFHQFLYDCDFADAPEIGYNRTIRTGNTIDNSRQVYPHGIIVDFHTPASNPGGMDWASLRLVFEKFKGTWYIVGVIHDHWNT